MKEIAKKVLVATILMIPALVNATTIPGPYF